MFARKTLNTTLTVLSLQIVNFNIPTNFEDLNLSMKGSKNFFGDSQSQKSPFSCLYAFLNLDFTQLVGTDGIQSFQFGNQKKTGDRQQRSISRSKLDIDFESR